MRWRDLPARVRAAAKPRAHSAAIEREFLPAAIELAETPPPAAARWIIYVLLGVFTIGIVAAYVGRVDIVVTARGTVIPKGHVKVIQPWGVGIVRAIHVEPGERVEPGQPLVDLDPTASKADTAQLAQEIDALRIRIARLHAQSEALAAPPRGGSSPRDESEGNASWIPSAADGTDSAARETALLEHTLRAFVARKQSLEREVERRLSSVTAAERSIEATDRTLPMVRERVTALEQLARQQIIPRLELLRARQELVELESQRAVRVADLASAHAGVEAARDQLVELAAATTRDTLEQLAEAERRRNALAEELRKAEQRARLDQLRSPIRGIVQDLAVHTQGGVVTPAQPIMSIVPTDATLEVEATIADRDIGFVRVGQDAEVKVDAFRFTRYGTLPARIVDIAPDAVVEESLGRVYRTRVALLVDEFTVAGAKTRISPGMAVAVEVRTGSRRLIEFLAGPLLRYSDEAMREP